MLQIVNPNREGNIRIFSDQSRFIRLDRLSFFQRVIYALAYYAGRYMQIRFRDDDGERICYITATVFESLLKQ